MTQYNCKTGHTDSSYQYNNPHGRYLDGQHSIWVNDLENMYMLDCGCGLPNGRLACICHYGIITTNGKSLDFQGVSAFVAVYSIPFPRLKYGEKIDEKRRLLH